MVSTACDLAGVSVTAAELLAAFDVVPRVGWVREATPIVALPELAREVGLEWLGVKRESAIGPLFGGSKVRKLDCMLAREPYAGAEGWVSIGAIGSGHLVAMTAAAEALERRLDAHVFWEPPIPEVLENLAFIASGPTRVFDHGSRAGLMTAPRLLLGGELGGWPIVPPGASAPAGIAGIVRGAVELAAQIEARELPVPDRVYVALGSGGTAVGIAIGLALAGHRVPVCAVAAIERPLVPFARLRDMTRGARDFLADAGLGPQTLATDLPTNLRVIHGWVGPGYGVASAASIRACARLAACDVALEPIYSGKAMAALLAAAERGEGGRALLWLTPRRAGPLPHAEDWISRLPPSLATRIAAGSAHRPLPFTRRRLLVAGVAAASGVAIWARLSGYLEREGWSGAALSGREAAILDAAAEVLIGDDARGGDLAGRVDRFVATLPAAAQREVHAMFLAVEHGTPRRMTELDRPERAAYFDRLASRTGLLALIYRGMRDLCMLGHYQQPRTWLPLGYEGPWVPAEPRKSSPYEALVAPPGARPRTLIS